MKQTTTSLSAIKLRGLAVRTSNVIEMNPSTAKIGETINAFYSLRKPSARLFSVYTDYSSDEHGEYTYFFGEEITDRPDSIANQSAGADLQSLTIPAQHYVKFTTESGEMPSLVVNAWQTIWQMTPVDLGGARAYLADFEVYDERAQNPSAAVIDVYVGLAR